MEKTEDTLGANLLLAKCVLGHKFKKFDNCGILSYNDFKKEIMNKIIRAVFRDIFIQIPF